MQQQVVKIYKKVTIAIQRLLVQFNSHSKISCVIGIVLRILCGALFLFSGYSKLFPVEFFEYQLVGDHLANWTSAAFLARFIIGLEFFLGFALLLTFDYKNSIVKTAGLLTILFTLYLVILLFVKGNEANCNCFGQYIKMSVTESLVKNVS